MHGSAQRGAAGVTLPLSLQNPPASSSASWGRGSRVAKRAALVLASVGVLAHRLRPSESASGVLPRKRGRSASARRRPDKPRSSVGNAMHRIEAGTGRERRRGNRTFWRLSPARFSRTSRRSCGTRPPRPDRSSAGASMRCGGPPVHICKRATAVAVHGPDRPSRVHPRATTVRRSEPGSQIPGNHRLDRIECGRVMPVRRRGVEQRPQFLPACKFEPLQQVAADPLHVVGLDWRQRACPGQGRGLRGYAAGAGEVQGPASFRTARPYRHPANPASPACAAVAPRSCAVHAGAGRSAAGPW